MKKKWYVIYTKPQQEIKVSRDLTAIGIKNYCPTVTTLKKYSDRLKKINKPLLPSYVMVYLEEKNRESVFISSGVVRYLFFLGKPAVIPSSEISLLKNHLNGFIYNDVQLTSLVKGSKYKITKGPFTGVSGNIIELDKTMIKLEIISLGLTLTLQRQAA